LKKILNNLVKSRFVKNSLVLFSGNVFNQLILLFTYPIISRLFLPTDFGTFEQVHAIFVFLVILTSLRYESAIIIAKSDQEAKHLLILCLGLVVLLTLLVWLGIGVGGKYFADLLSNPQLTKFLYFLPIFLLFAGGQQVFYNWEIRRKRFSQANLSNIFKSSSNSVFRVATGFVQLSTVGLFIARGISYFLSFWVLLKKEWNTLTSIFSNQTITARRLVTAAKTYKEFPLYMSWGVVFNRLSITIIPLVISFLYGVKFLGYYAIANQALNIPIAVVRNAIRTVYLQRASERINSGKDLYNDLIRISLVLLSLGILPLILIVLYGSPIFTFILGERWLMAGKIASVISPWIYITIVATPCSAVIPVVGLQRYYAVFQFIILCTRVLVLYIGATFFSDPLDVIKLLVIQGIVVNIFNFGYVLIKTYQKDKLNKDAFQ